MKILVQGLISLLCCGGVITAAEELPKIVRDQLEVVQPGLTKAYTEYRKKVMEENNKLISVIQKAMEKATKAGKLDEAVALKNALEQAKSGELIKPFLEPGTTDLLGTATPGGTSDGPAVITLSTGDPVESLAANKPTYNNRDYLFSAVPPELQGFSYAQRPFKEPTPCTIKVVNGGVLYVVVGVPADGLDFAGMGFVATDLTVRSATGELTIVKKGVRTGETITLPPSATTNSFPIWKAK